MMGKNNLSVNARHSFKAQAKKWKGGLGLLKFAAGVVEEESN